MTMKMSKSSISIILFIGYLLLVTPVKATSTLSFGYVDHPEISPFIEIVEQSYSDLNIKITLNIVGQENGLFALDKGVADGDIARSINGINRYDNIISVGQPLVVATNHLLCIKGKPCSIELLKNPKTEIIMTAGNIKGMPNWMRETFQAQAYLIDDYRTFNKLVKQKKFDYAIAILGADAKPSVLFDGYQSIALYNANIYHVLHKKHRQLAVEVAPILNKYIQALYSKHK